MYNIQITGDDLQDMALEVLREIAPNRTRVECKLLLRRIKDAETAAQVSIRVEVMHRVI